MFDAVPSGNFAAYKTSQKIVFSCALKEKQDLVNSARPPPISLG